MGDLGRNDTLHVINVGRKVRTSTKVGTHFTGFCRQSTTLYLYLCSIYFEFNWDLQERVVTLVGIY